MTQQINLYEARLRPRHELATARNLAMAAVLLLALTSSLSFYLRHEAERKADELAALQGTVRSAQEQMVALSKSMSGRSVSPALLAEQAQVRALLSSRAEVLAVLDSGRLGNTSGFSEFMYGFARQGQSEPWLTGFTVSAGGDEIEIRGGLLDPPKLPAYVQRLSSEPVFHGRRFAMLEMQNVEPDAPKPEAAAAAGKPAPPAMPRHVTFSLRSSGIAAAGGEAKVAAEPMPLLSKAEQIMGAPPGSLKAEKL